MFCNPEEKNSGVSIIFFTNFIAGKVNEDNSSFST